MYSNRQTYTYTTQRAVRAAFWEAHPSRDRRRKLRNGDYHVETRCAFTDYVDHLARNGDISDALAQRVTL